MFLEKHFQEYASNGNAQVVKTKRKSGYRRYIGAHLVNPVKK
jgi:hypothetical protein